MKKSIHTLLTAALFATANLSAMPAVAEDGSSVCPKPETLEAVSMSASSEDGENSVNNALQGFDEAAIRKTNKPMAPVYGPPPTTTVTTTTEKAFVTTTTTQTLYGAPITSKLVTTTTTMPPQPAYGAMPTTSVVTSATTSKTTKQTTTTTTSNIFTTTTTTAPQPVYGPPLQDYVGDVNLDGSVDTFDILAARKMLLSGKERYSDGYMEAYYADLNNDGKLTVADLILLQEYVLGKVSKQELQQRFNYWYGSHNIDIEQITTAPNDDNKTTTTTTTTYEPRKDVTVTLYGIAPSRNAREQMINPTTETTADISQTEEK